MRDTRQPDMTDYDDPIFRDQGMIGTLESRSAILAGPFLAAAGLHPTSEVLWTSPDRQLVAIHTVYVDGAPDEDEQLLRLCNGAYFDGAWQHPSRYEEAICREWNSRRTAYRRKVLDQIDYQRLRQQGGGAELSGILAESPEIESIYANIAECVWKAWGI